MNIKSMLYKLGGWGDDTDEHEDQRTEPQSDTHNTIDIISSALSEHDGNPDIILVGETTYQKIVFDINSLITQEMTMVLGMNVIIQEDVEKPLLIDTSADVFPKPSDHKE